MPELPEVEVLARHLDLVLPGARVTDVAVPKPRLIRPHAVAGFTRALKGAVVGPVTRRAKYLIFELTDARGLPGVGTPGRLLAHLGMTGRMALVPADASRPRHAAVVLETNRGTWIFEDSRGFGRMTLDASVLDGLGPEPFSTDFSADHFARRLAGSKQPIKVRILNQEIVVGVGNIYAAEALFRSGISPRRPSHRLSRREIERLHAAIRDVLSEAIALGSSLRLDFSGDASRTGERLFYFGRAATGDGVSNGEERFQVYDREGRPCRRCASPIRRIAQAGRSSYYCPRCQH